MKVRVKDHPKPDEYFRQLTGGDRLQVLAVGPTTLSVRFRATGRGRVRVSGKLRIVRDDGPFSDNAYELQHDSAAKPDFRASIEGNSVTVERVIHVPVPEGTHHFLLGPVKGPPLLIRVFKTSKFDPDLAAAPEKNLSVLTVPVPGLQVKTGVVNEPAPPQPKPAKPAVEEPTPSHPTVVQTSPLPEDSSSAEQLPEKVTTEHIANPQLHSGLGVGLRIGTVGLLGFSENAAESTGFGLSNRLWSFAPFAAEIAWDANGYVSVFAEVSNVRATRAFGTPFLNDGVTGNIDVRSDYRLLPILVGVTVFVPIKTRFGVRFRVGAGAAFASALTAPLDTSGLLQPGTFQSAWVPSGTAGFGLEYRIGPGRISLEARYLAAPTTWFGSPSPVNGVNALPPDLGGLQFLGGYRFEFF